MNILQFLILGNSVSTWLAALILGIGLYALLMGIRQILRKRMARLASREPLDWSDLVYALLARTRGLFLLLVSLTAATLILNLSLDVRAVIRVVVMLVLLFQAGFWAVEVVDFFIARRVSRSGDDAAARKTTLNALGIIARLVIWTLVVLMALDNLPNVQITSLIASLGIGGIAIGLAVQNILGDLFSSLTIALDKPFRIDDSITVGEFVGKVEHIGLKSTRLRSISGEQLVFSNSDLLKSRIRNYQDMARRRVPVILTVSGHTPSAKLEKIPSMLREIIEAQADTTFDRAHFKEFGNYGLMFELVYYIESDDYGLYMDRQHAINLAILRRFDAEGIDMPYPTQEVILRQK